MTRWCDVREGIGRLLRGRGQGPRRQDRRELGDQRALRPPQRKASTSPRAGPADQLARSSTHHRWHDFGQDRQDLFEIVWTEGGDPRPSSKRAAEAGHRQARSKRPAMRHRGNPTRSSRSRKPTMLGWFVVRSEAVRRRQPAGGQEILKPSSESQRLDRTALETARSSCCASRSASRPRDRSIANRSIAIGTSVDAMRRQSRSGTRAGRE